MRLKYKYLLETIEKKLLETNDDAYWNRRTKRANKDAAEKAFREFEERVEKASALNLSDLFKRVNAHAYSAYKELFGEMLTGDETRFKVLVDAVQKQKPLEAITQDGSIIPVVLQRDFKIHKAGKSFLEVIFNFRNLVIQNFKDQEEFEWFLMSSSARKNLLGNITSVKAAQQILGKLTSALSQERDIIIAKHDFIAMERQLKGLSSNRKSMAFPVDKELSLQAYKNNLQTATEANLDPNLKHFEESITAQMAAAYETFKYVKLGLPTIHEPSLLKRGLFGGTTSKKFVEEIHIDKLQYEFLANKFGEDADLFSKTNEFIGKESYSLKIDEEALPNVGWVYKSLNSDVKSFREGSDVDSTGDPKSDIVLVANPKSATGLYGGGAPVFHISHKDGEGAAAFQQWGGISSKAGSSVHMHPEVQKFFQQAKVMYESDEINLIKSGFDFYKRIEDPTLVGMSMFGPLFSLENEESSYENVDAIIQGFMSLNPVDEQRHELSAHHIITRRKFIEIASTGIDNVREYLKGAMPVLGARYNPKRNIIFGGGTLKGLRAGAFSFSSRRWTGHIEDTATGFDFVYFKNNDKISFEG